MAAGLLLVQIFGLADGGDGLAVGHAAVADVDLDLELAEQLVGGELDVGLAEAGEDGFAAVAVALDSQGGVFLDEAGEAGAELVDVGLGAGLDGGGEDRRGHFGRCDQQVGVGRAEGVEGGGVGEFGDDAEVAGGHLRCDLHLFALGVREAGEALVVARAGVLQVGIAAQGAGGDAQVGEPPDEFVGGGFEDERGGVCAGVGVEALVERGRFERVGEGGGDQAEDRGDADVGGGAGGQDGRERAGEQGGLESGREVVLGQLFVFEVGQHQLFVGFDDPLDQRVAAGRGSGGDIGRGFGGVCAVALVGAAAEHLDCAAELRLRADRQEERLALGAEHALDAFQRVVPAGVFAVQAGDHDGAGNAAAARHAPDGLGADLHAGGSIDDEDGGVGDGDGGDDFADEVGVAGSVEQVDAEVAVGERDERGADRHAAVAFFGVEVGDGVAVFNAPDAGNRPGRKRERLNERRLARALVPHDGDVADVLSGSGHISLRARASNGGRQLRGVIRNASRWCGWGSGGRISLPAQE